MKRKLQTDWFDTFFRKPVQVEFMGHNEYIARVRELRAKGVNVDIVTIKRGGYEIQFRLPQ